MGMKRGPYNKSSEDKEVWSAMWKAKPAEAKAIQKLMQQQQKPAGKIIDEAIIYWLTIKHPLILFK